MILAIDYDDTIVYSNYPDSGEIKPNAVEVINRLHDEGHHIIIWTCRMDEPLLKAKQYLIEQGVKFHNVNEHKPELIIQYGNDTRKIYADIYIDDKQLGGLPNDWLQIEKLIKNKL